MLFDIDGTLMDSGGAGTRSVYKAFKQVLGIEHETDGISMAGKTDPQILREMLKLHGVEDNNGIIPKLTKAYLDNLSVEITNASKHLKPGVVSILVKLSAIRKYELGLLTGNVEQGAMIKLSSLGIMDYFKFGAFGSDDENRVNLMPIAVKRFKELKGQDIPYSDCVVIGDTPRDVQCAKPHGARVIAIATGPFNKNQLSDAGADMVLSDMTDHDAILNFIG